MIIPAIAGALMALAIVVLRLPLHLGAHPQWADVVAWSGGGFGLVMSLALSTISTRAGLSLTLAGSVTCLGVAVFGKGRFAASFAEDRLAGQMWSFGWIGTVAFVVATTVLLTRTARQGL